MRTLERRERGTAMVAVTLAVVVFSVLALAVLQDSSLRTTASMEEHGDTQALALAEAGVALKLAEMAETQGAATDALSLTAAEGTLQVTVTQDGDYLVVRSSATSQGGAGPVTRTVEATIRAQYHPLFYKATYMGNAEDLTHTLTLGPNVGTQTGGETYRESNWVHRNTRLSERGMNVDFNGDGDFDDSPRLRDIYSNRSSWGWSGHISRSSNRRYHKLDINQNGSYSDTYTAPTVSTSPTPRDPDSDLVTPSQDPLWDTSSKTDDGDYIEGDVYVNGDLALTGSTDVFGDLDATGGISGEPVSGASTESTTPILPPDLTAMNYSSVADTVVTTSNVPSYMMGQKSSSYYGSELGSSSAHTNPYFHLGNQSGKINFGSGDTDTLILVEGNLWLHSTSTFTIETPRSRDHVVTIVVEGNLYIADDLEYGTADSGILFIVKGNDDSPESYVDANRNYAYDSGETILNDDGDGVYEGPKEGQGNVFFGDPRFGTGGVTDGFIYAQHNVYMVNPPTSVNPPQGQDAIFGVSGFLSAGGLIDLGQRESGDDYNNFRVKYDNRIENGSLVFPGMPPAMGGQFDGLSVVSWREVR